MGQIRTDLGLEAKTASAFATGRASEWGESGSDQVPEAYLVQCATYMALTECPKWDLAVLFGNTEFRIYHLTRDEELEALLLDEASRFWTDHVLARVPPDPTSEAEARQRWPRHADGQVLEADDALLVMLQHLADCKRRGKAVAEEEQALKDLILPILKDADSVRRGEMMLASYRANKDSQRTDWQRVAGVLMQDQPIDQITAIVANYTHSQPGSRVLRLAKDLERLL